MGLLLSSPLGTGGLKWILYWSATLARRKTPTNKRNRALNKPLQSKLSKQYSAQLPTHLGMQYPRISIMESPTSQGLPTQYYLYLTQDIPYQESDLFDPEWHPSQNLDPDLVPPITYPNLPQPQGNLPFDPISYEFLAFPYTSDLDQLASYENNLTHLAEPFFEYDHNPDIWEEPNSLIEPRYLTDTEFSLQPESLVVPASSEHPSTTPEASERTTAMDSSENSDQITYSCTFTDCQKTFCRRSQLKYARIPSSAFPSCESNKSG